MSDFDKIWVEGDRDYYDGNQSGGCTLQVIYLAFVLVLALFL